MQKFTVKNKLTLINIYWGEKYDNCPRAPYTDFPSTCMMMHECA